MEPEIPLRGQGAPVKTAPSSGTIKAHLTAAGKTELAQVKHLEGPGGSECSTARLSSEPLALDDLFLSLEFSAH